MQVKANMPVFLLNKTQEKQTCETNTHTIYTQKNTIINLKTTFPYELGTFHNFLFLSQILFCTENAKLLYTKPFGEFLQ